MEVINENPRIELHLGDCLKVMKSIPDKSIDLVLTDPPYGINKEGIINDDLSAEDYKKWMEKY